MLLFHLYNIPFSNAAILASCGSKLRRVLFKLTLVKELKREKGRVPQNQTTTRERQAPSISQLNTLDSRHNKHRVLEGKRTRRRAWSAINKVTRAKLNLRLLMSYIYIYIYIYIYGAPILDVSRSHTTTQHSR